MACRMSDEDSWVLNNSSRQSCKIFVEGCTGVSNDRCLMFRKCLS